MNDEAQAALLDGIEDDLVQSTDAGDGSREYELIDGVLYVTHYWLDQFDDNGAPVPTRRYYILHMTLEESK